MKPKAIDKKRPTQTHRGRDIGILRLRVGRLVGSERLDRPARLRRPTRRAQTEPVRRGRLRQRARHQSGGCVRGQRPVHAQRNRRAARTGYGDAAAAAARRAQSAAAVVAPPHRNDSETVFAQCQIASEHEEPFGDGCPERPAASPARFPAARSRCRPFRRPRRPRIK